MRKIILERQASPDPEVLQGFKDLLSVYSPSCVVADAQQRQGVMRSFMRPLSTQTRFVGPALTVRLEPGNQVDCLDALSVAQVGDVIVVDAAGETAIRDTDETRDLGFFIFSKAIVPRSTHTPYSGRMDPIEVNVPIQCAGVVVRPGDLVLGDEIGVVVIPLENAAAVLQKAREQADKEEMTRAKIREGKTVEQLLAEFGRL